MSRARNASEIAFWPGPAQPSAEIMHVEGAKRRRDCVLTYPLRKSCASRARNAGEICGDRACRGREMQVRLRFGPVRRNPLRRSRVSRARNAGEIAFRIGRASLLEEVSYKTLVLETWRFTFGGRLERNARFGDLVLHFWRKSRTKRSFWRLGASLFHFGSWTQTWPVCSANVMRERAFRSWTQKWPVCSNIVRERAFRS